MTKNGETTYVELNNINVVNMSSNAGIFVGPNNQWGWSSHYKEIGIMEVRGNGNKARFNNNIIYDNDREDFHFDDRDFMVNNMGYYGDTSIDLHSININSLNDNSGTFAGENNQFAWGAHGKTNVVNSVRGYHNSSSSYYNTIDDRDQTDAFMNDPDVNHNTIYRKD